MKWNDLGVRAASGLMMAIVGFGAIAFGGWPFRFLVISLGILILMEWRGITRTSPQHHFWLALGVIYAMMPVISLLWLRDVPHGRERVLLLVTAVVATDIGAYFAGRLIGGPKLAPQISPKKTWAGLAGGMLLAAISARLLFPTHPVHAFLATGFAVIAQMGDLAESALKRRFNVKDSGQLIPGHGGVMDRLDGLILAAPIAAILTWGTIYL